MTVWFGTIPPAFKITLEGPSVFPFDRKLSDWGFLTKFFRKIRLNINTNENTQVYKCKNGPMIFKNSKFNHDHPCQLDNLFNVPS